MNLSSISGKPIGITGLIPQKSISFIIYMKKITDNLIYPSDSEESDSEPYFHIPTKEEYREIVKQKFIKEVCGLDPASPSKCHWITINFEDKQVSPNDIPILMKNKILCKRCCQDKKYYYSIEQRSEIINSYSGYHVHLLIAQLKKPKSHIIREFYQALKSYVGTKQHINVKLYKGSQFWTEKLDYLNGVKDDKEKELKTENDKHFRKKYNLKNLYTNEKNLSK